MNKQQLIQELKKEGFSDKILKAFETIKREDFIPEKFKEYAYENEPLPIEEGATISQPYTIAFMLNLLELKDNQKILEIGSGSGYVLALINEISKNSEIYGIERIKGLVESSKKILKDGKNIQIIQGDGSKGLKEKAPFDRILVSASADKIPESLFEQLSKNGILVLPVQNSIFQIKKINNQIIEKEFRGFVFVPLIEKE
ncbi:protein-L-isoaspartate(D-aspartate) O-methyltransferase [Candidatus Pacearchaeota archaeon]|nr:protein-L-isoaspartate(D-aspartate) O-methyltransferase [Candidatus Pacearchaeota archaeon]